MRREFSKTVRRDALRRAEGACEATGAAYGLAADTRCNASLAYGLDFDHVLPDALGGEPTLDNCACVCRRCHDHKTRQQDVPSIAKAVRVEEKRWNLRVKSTRWPKRSFGRPA